MAWTTPKTYSSLEDLTYTEMNTYQRDNLNETAPAIATAAGRLIVTDGANSIVERVPTSDVDVTNTATFTNTSFLSLANVTGGTALPAEVEVVVTTGAAAIVLYAAAMSNSAAGNTGYLSVSVSGATTTSASDNWAAYYESSAATDVTRIGVPHLFTLTPGSNTFTLAARVGGGTGTVLRAEILVIPL